MGYVADTYQPKRRRRKKKIKTKFLLKICTQKFMNEIFNVIDKENERIHVKIGTTKEKKSPGPVL